MALANQQGQLLLSTGNKSELAVGYCTLYGDMNGGLAVIGDLYKSTVFALCAWLDTPASGPCRAALGLPAEGELIGAAIRSKPPSAELRPDQRDSDSLPDYAVLDFPMPPPPRTHRGDRGEAALLRLIELARPLDHSTCQIVIRDLRNLGILFRLDHMRIYTL